MPYSSAPLARVYAEALAEAAEAQGGRDLLEEVGAWFDAFGKIWAENRSFRGHFVSGSVPGPLKQETLQRLGGGKMPRLLGNTLRLLLERGRFPIVGEVAEAYRAIVDKRLGRTPVTIWTATPVPPERLVAWIQTVRQALGTEPVVRHVVKPELVAGAVVRAGDLVADGSARRRLMELRKRILQRGKHASQP
jgi:F-type H+-transporting ATPase subunit delta